MEMNTFYIRDEDWNKILGYARMTYDLMSTEIGGMAVVRKENEDMWIISDATILKQEVTAAICHLDKEELANWYSAMAEKYKEDLINKKLMYCWWHSHHTMGASMSHTDWDTISDTKNGLSLVVNNKGEHELILCSSNPVNIQVECELKTLASLVRDGAMKEEIERLVTKEITSIRTAYSYNGYGHPISPNRLPVTDRSTNQLSLLSEEKEDPLFADLKSIPIPEEDVDIYGDDSAIDTLSYEIDMQLESLKDGKSTPQEIIDYIESCNKTLPKPLFKIPPPNEIEKINSAFELIV